MKRSQVSNVLRLLLLYAFVSTAYGDNLEPECSVYKADAFPMHICLSDDVWEIANASDNVVNKYVTVDKKMTLQVIGRENVSVSKEQIRSNIVDNTKQAVGESFQFVEEAQVFIDGLIFEKAVYVGKWQDVGIVAFNYYKSIKDVGVIQALFTMSPDDLDHNLVAMEDVLRSLRFEEQ